MLITIMNLIKLGWQAAYFHSLPRATRAPHRLKIYNKKDEIAENGEEKKAANGKKQNAIYLFFSLLIGKRKSLAQNTFGACVIGFAAARVKQKLNAIIFRSNQ